MSRYRELVLSQVPLALLGACFCYEFHRGRLALEKIAGIENGNGLPIYMVVVFVVSAFLIGYFLKSEKSKGH